MGYPEWSAGLGLGVLPVLGAYFVQTGTYSIDAVLASIPSGILVHNLLLLNEFGARRLAAAWDLPIRAANGPRRRREKESGDILFRFEYHCLSLDNRYSYPRRYAGLRFTGITDVLPGFQGNRRQFQI